MKAPFPWFGGKSRAAGIIWPRFGDTLNYVEPFAGSLAVLLSRPHEARIETVNDKDAYLANFWRAVSADPDAVAHAADWPVNEADLHARHRWLAAQDGFRDRMPKDPDYFDAKIAGWWVWGICQWIGSGWCSQSGWTGRTNAGRAGRGIHSAEHRSRPDLTTLKMPAEPGQRGNLTQKRPSLPRGQRGINRSHGQQLSQQLPNISGDGGASGRGIHSKMIRENLLNYMLTLQGRLRRVRVCCGDWTRILSPSATMAVGLTAVMLDPPYADTAGRDGQLYNEDSLTVAHNVREWAVAHGHDPKLRIALCGYQGEHEMPADWECVSWKANGGYANQKGDRTKGKENADRERIWFSPNCLKPARNPELFNFA